jgi:hypothetical protein
MSHYGARKSLPLVLQMNPVYAVISYVFQIYFNIFSPSGFGGSQAVPSRRPPGRGTFERG